MAPTAVKAVCISHSGGAGGEAIGRTVAARLGFRYVDEEVIAEAAEFADLSPAFVADVERRRSFVARLLGNVAERSSATRLEDHSPGRDLPTDADLRALIRSALQSIAEQGSVVIVAHAASVALGGSRALRVLVTASADTRARRVAATTSVDDRAAAKAVKDDDLARADYLRRFYGVDSELPTHFDLVVNTDFLTPDVAAETVVVAARSGA